jgi:hypothetical protein
MNLSTRNLMPAERHGKTQQPVIDLNTVTRSGNKGPQHYLFRGKDMEDTVDQGQSQGHKGIDGPDHDTVQDLLKEKDHKEPSAIGTF